MTQYLKKSFSVPIGDSKAYRDNYDAVFGRKGAEKKPAHVDRVERKPSKRTKGKR